MVAFLICCRFSTLRGKRNFASSTLCIIVTVPDFETWKYIAPIQMRAWLGKVFENGTWGGEIRSGFEPRSGDIVALEHWCSSGFADTDLDLQLKQHGIYQLIVMDCWPIRAWRLPFALPPSLATRSRW